MEPVLQLPTDLRLVILKGDDVGPLSVLSRKTISCGLIEATFRIIGESHWITVCHNGDVLFHEILSCSDYNHPEVIHYHEFNNGLPHSYTESGYSVGVGFSQTKEAQFELDANMRVEFPDPIGDGIKPFTSISWEIQPTELSWTTTHFYTLPGGNVVVRSTSRFEMSLAQPMAVSSERRSASHALSI